MLDSPDTKGHKLASKTSNERRKFNFFAMNRILRKTGKVFLMLGCMAGFNSCYFNSTGHIFDAASHNAAVRLSDLKQGSAIYSDGVNHYVYLPRYRYDTKVVTQYGVGGKRDSDGKKHLTNEADRQLVKITPEQLQYLKGESSVLNSDKVIPVDEDVKDYCFQTATVNQGVTSARLSEYRYTSGAAPYLYSAGVLNWLCVDLPMTCVENALAVPLFLLTWQYPESVFHGGSLRDAARENNLTEARKLLQEGVDVDLPDGDGWTPLIYAARNGNRQMCELLIKHGANVDAMSRPGRIDRRFSANALHWAATRGHTDCVVYLISQGINKNLVADDGYTPLDDAVRNGYTECAAAMRQLGCVHSGRSLTPSSSNFADYGSYYGSSSGGYDFEQESWQRQNDQRLENEAVWQRQREEGQF